MSQVNEPRDIPLTNDTDLTGAWRGYLTAFYHPVTTKIGSPKLLLTFKAELYIVWEGGKHMKQNVNSFWQNGHGH